VGIATFHIRAAIDAGGVPMVDSFCELYRIWIQSGSGGRGGDRQSDKISLQFES
jgi:hypothetical protein